ncbi:MAG: UvrB/UvrC motif-containing protein [Planctomycetota bacterium]|jgi:hypothetical protein
MSDFDLTDVLQSWPYHPGRIIVRKIEGTDGRPKLQVRVDLGILQMEMSGRPDGRNPEGHDSVLALQQSRRDRYTQQSGEPGGFVLSRDECRDLREEAVQLYHRYVALFSLGEYTDVIRDTCHSLRIFDLCRQHAAEKSDAAILEQFRAHVVMMRGRAEAELAISRERPRDALAALGQALEEIRGVYADQGRADEFESANEVQLLRGMRDALVPKLPASQRVELEERLQAAIDAENYELAAILRDELRLM